MPARFSVRVPRFFDHQTLHSASIHSFLRALRGMGFEGASLPIGIQTDGQERLDFIEGDVPIPPYPEWAQGDDALASIASLMLRFHEASASVTAHLSTWSDELADPSGGPIVCHNDMCMENVVFRDGVAVGLLDFDFAAPGRPIYDLAQFARMCVPIDDDMSAERLGWNITDNPARLRLVSDTYGLDTKTRDGPHRLSGSLHESRRRLCPTPSRRWRPELHSDVGGDGWNRALRAAQSAGGRANEWEFVTALT